MMHSTIKRYIYLLTGAVVISACSMTKGVPDDDQLFIGLTKINYTDYEENDNYSATREEIDAALATAPNGAILGSSYHRLPFSFGLSVWNAFSADSSGLGHWMNKTFGKQPVLMSWVNPQLRAQVAKSVLRNHGYFHGNVDAEVVQQNNMKTAKIGYDVSFGHLFTLDSVRYVGFNREADSLIHATSASAIVRKGDPFVVANLDGERSRISNLLRNNGYYYYQPSYASYLADTFAVDGKVQLRFQLAEETPAQARHKWYIGRVNINMRKTYNEAFTDSMVYRYLTIRYAGRRPPVRTRVIIADMKIRPRQLYSYDDYLQSAQKINAMGLFSSTEFQFTPRDNSPSCDTLDLTLNCTFDKPWDSYIETNFNGSAIGRVGPEVKLGLVRRNAFHGGEKIDLSVHGSYEWATNSSSSMSNYEYGFDASIEFPRLIAPYFGGNSTKRYTLPDGRTVRLPRRFYATPSTVAKVSSNTIRRPGYYKMHIVSGKWAYNWQTSATSKHEFSPLTVKYQFMNSHTAEFDKVMEENPYLRATMQDYFVPEMRYSYTYTSPSTLRHPVRWTATVSESGNFTSLALLAFGKKWNEREKKLFKNPYSQFVKIETDFTKIWTLDASSQLLGHVNAGVLYCFGNTDWAPNTELFYVGGANSIRAFSVRGIGPGSFPGIEDKAMSYLMQNGDIKLVCNLEYRRNLFGSLYGAVFLDAGNVWNVRDNYGTSVPYATTKFKIQNVLREMAVGTGLGLRYDLDFLVLRLDWGIGIHVPYDTGKGGIYNVDGFKKNQTLHFAIGYPF